jgi:hypothetical protein
MLCAVHANHSFATTDLPVSHGSIRIEYAPFTDLKSDADGCASGEKMRRKLASAFRCLTVNDMADQTSPRRRTNEDAQAMASCLKSFARRTQEVAVLDTEQGRAKAYQVSLHPTKQRPLCFSHECVISPVVVGRRRSPRLFLPLGAGRAANLSIIGGAHHPFGVPGTGIPRPLLGPMKTPFAQAKGGSINTSE